MKICSIGINNQTLNKPSFQKQDDKSCPKCNPAQSQLVPALKALPIALMLATMSPACSNVDRCDSKDFEKQATEMINQSNTMLSLAELAKNSDIKIYKKSNELYNIKANYVDMDVNIMLKTSKNDNNEASGSIEIFNGNPEKTAKYLFVINSYDKNVKIRFIEDGGKIFKEAVLDKNDLEGLNLSKVFATDSKPLLDNDDFYSEFLNDNSLLPLLIPGIALSLLFFGIEASRAKNNKSQSKD